MDEGFGTVAADKAKFKNGTNNASWGMREHGTAFNLDGNHALELDKVSSVQILKDQDFTLSFWMRTDITQEATLFSNGRGNEDEPLQTGGFRNKMAVQMQSNGALTLKAENINYNVSNSSVADDEWHHIAIAVKRNGNLNTYVDGEQTSSVPSTALGGFSALKYWIGARGFLPVAGNQEVDEFFNGQIDEVRLWSGFRNADVINRDMHFELDRTTPGLILYSTLNENSTNPTATPRYNRLVPSGNIEATNAVLLNSNGSTVATTSEYITTGPILKLNRLINNIPFDIVINDDEMIIEPQLNENDWYIYENQIMTITVEQMYDQYNNRQENTEKWTAFVNRQEIEWYVDNRQKFITAEKEVNQPFAFEVLIENIGGNNQPYTISGLPSWMSTDTMEGVLGPNSSRTIEFTVDENLGIGTYEQDLFIDLANNYTDKITLNLRVIQLAPDWSVNPSDYEFNMNTIGQIKLNGVLSRDTYTKVGAFVNDEPRGEAYLTYDDVRDSYFTFLTIYSNESAGEIVHFKIWDAFEGKTIQATQDGESTQVFIQNSVLGTKSNPKIYEAQEFVEQNIEMRNGWTWISAFVNDEDFNDVNTLFEDIQNAEGDLIKTQRITNNGNSEIVFTQFGSGFWLGSLTSFSNLQMFKVKLNQEANLRLLGTEVNRSTTEFRILEGWNWLPFPFNNSSRLDEALAFFEAEEGDVIKDQYSFAIYDDIIGWTGNLSYLQNGRGYMLRATNAQVFMMNQINQTSVNGADGEVSGRNNDEENQNLDTFSSNEYQDYEHTMNLVVEVPEALHITAVHVFDSDQNLRGTCPINQDLNIGYLNVYSNTNEALTYHMVANDGQIYIATEHYDFSANAVLGTYKEPVPLTSSVLSDLEFEIVTDSIIIYPNPFEDNLFIGGIPSEKVQGLDVKVYDISGRLILSKNFNESDFANEKVELDVKNFDSGSYLVNITLNKNKLITKKIIKR